LKELVLDRAPLPAAHHPNITGPQVVGQREQRGGFPRAAVLDGVCGGLLFSTASRQAGRRKLVGGLFGHVLRPLLYTPCSSSTARNVAAAAGRAWNRNVSRTIGPSRCMTSQARLARAFRSTLSGRAKRSASATLAASLSHPTADATAPSRSAPHCLASINAAPSLASKRTLSLTARASRRTAFSSRASARRNIRPTARLNRPTLSSVRRVVVSRRWRPGLTGGEATRSHAGAGRHSGRPRGRVSAAVLDARPRRRWGRVRQHAAGPAARRSAMSAL